jgi:hypothetical protein
MRYVRFLIFAILPFCTCCANYEISALQDIVKKTSGLKSDCSSSYIERTNGEKVASVFNEKLYAKDAFAYLDSIIRNEKIVLFSGFNHEHYELFSKLVLHIGKYKKVKVGLLFGNLPPGKVIQNERRLNDEPSFEYSVNRLRLERALFKNRIDIFNLSCAFSEPSILVGVDTLEDGSVQKSYKNVDSSFYQQFTFAIDGGVRIDGNWDKELNGASITANHIQKDSAIWLVFFGESHLYEDRTFSVANYLNQHYKISPLTVSMTTLLEMDKLDARFLNYNQNLTKFKEPVCLFTKNSTPLKFPQSPRRFDLMVAFSPEQLEYSRKRNPPNGFSYGKVHTNFSKDTIAMFTYLKSEFKKFNTKGMPIDSYLLPPGDSIKTLIPNSGEKVKKIKLIVKKDEM